MWKVEEVSSSSSLVSFKWFTTFISYMANTRNPNMIHACLVKFLLSFKMLYVIWLVLLCMCIALDFDIPELKCYVLYKKVRISCCILLDMLECFSKLIVVLHYQYLVISCYRLCIYWKLCWKFSLSRNFKWATNLFSTYYNKTGGSCYCIFEIE